MFNPEQLVETSWGVRNKKYYENLGYTYTGIGTKLIVKAKDLVNHSSALVNVTCDYCGVEFTKTYTNYYKEKNKDRIACEKCKSKKAHDNIKEQTVSAMYNKFVYACNILGYDPVSTIDEYENASSKMSYLCPKHGLQTSIVDRIANGKGCRECAIESNANKRRKTIEEVISIVESKNNNKILNPEDYINMRTKNLYILCGSCNNINLRSLESVQSSSGKCCSCASSEVAKQWMYTPQQVKEIIESINHNILLNPNEYIGIKDANLKIQCGLCHNIYKTSLESYKSGFRICCPECSKSISNPERIIINYLNNNNISYEYQYTFSDCRYKSLLRFDFYIPSMKLAIEYNGEQHYKPIDFYGGDQSLIETQKRDDIKINYCINNNIDILIISCADKKYILDILNDKLLIKNKIQS